MKKLWALLLVVLLAGCSSVLDRYPDMTKPLRVSQVDEKELQELLLSEYAVIIYAIPDDPWSQIAMPILNNVAASVNQEVYYFNIEKDREEETELYHLAYDPIVRYLRQTDYFERIYDVLYVPTVVVIENANIKEVHIGTVTGHTKVDGVVPPLTAEQQVELRTIYFKMMQ